MSKLGIRAKSRRRFKRTTDSNHDQPIAPNLLKQDFKTTAPNRVWCSDITYVRTCEGWPYLAVIIDLFARKVVGYAIADHMRTELTRMKVDHSVLSVKSLVRMIEMRKAPADVAVWAAMVSAEPLAKPLPLASRLFNNPCPASPGRR